MALHEPYRGKPHWAEFITDEEWKNRPVWAANMTREQYPEYVWEGQEAFRMLQQKTGNPELYPEVDRMALMRRCGLL
jgi:hypothetical protein